MDDKGGRWETWTANVSKNATAVATIADLYDMPHGRPFNSNAHNKPFTEHGHDTHLRSDAPYSEQAKRRTSERWCSASDNPCRLPLDSRAPQEREL